ncbi:phosphopyruvate hydratase [Candidatus Woesebacteria bacterium GWC2_33_12]|uniref:Enolase n=1 Tax=Candidatus Woesebacteria bacterium GW2011_GWB1_33_22 TaxID=1618566 RepID=A0A0G0C1E4_9BACT|nr:MAG: Enolase [Candidatus Woesebacteria bacterium GW2011_GWC2_33_12]KKP42269.1 MAG: Enolase [Candidatus Woesebacteria bacterium GW2011_GWA2_33_20]KKP45000.1 MAG: Enolase [Candidatus Woesebacteria bacterium GW2011_GWB1_33_22]KKP46849.1 MAG: Enolase [Microgenomates group bacterium GW2011_GWC1_33_28]KKP50721.1 MAG: Enolase [Candidatus Woesebacteria bacterium GW2011_GWA1_33_33]OGM06798.1 MAG: phosphopyruvate hydratase [Candidatus Woesebacteria bacterium GWC2_33_12]OGM81077.1 MAG: phosphopyruvat
MIKRIWSREILDSRGVPTVECYCQLDDGRFATASVPAGTSTGSHEALELRDKDLTRYHGEGVLKAVENINKILGPAITGMDPTKQSEIDQKLISLDGTENKTKFGGNSILAISEVVCKIAASSQNKALYTWINELSVERGMKKGVKIPTPLLNMINGGLHGAGNLDFQEFWMIPATNKKFSDGLQMAVEIYQTIGDNLARRGAIHSVGHEGGYAPNLFTNADAFEVFVESVKQTNYSLGRDVFLGLDVAANSFYKNGNYTIRDRSSSLSDNQLLDYYKELISNYKLAILEDAFQEDAWDSWKKLTTELSGSVTVVGDDLLVTNPKRMQKAIDEKACNGAVIKPNQIGTVTETLQVVKMAKDVNWKLITSHRSGETNDSFIADFAVGIASDYAKFGAPARGERVAKYNRLSAIELELEAIT